MASKAAKAPKGAASNEPPKVIIVKKIIEGGHGGHHGGAWKVAYADFVTAMMAFFLLLWLLGATTERQRKALADYFTPTLVELRKNSAGSNGMFGGASIIDKDNYPHKAAQTGTRAITVPSEVGKGGDKEGTGDKGTLKGSSRFADRKAFEDMKRKLESTLSKDKRFKNIRSQLRFTSTPDGLQMDLVDRADFSMFATGTTSLVPQAAQLIGEIGRSISGLPNSVTIRGHTDSAPYGNTLAMNNWMLSTGRSEAVRRKLNGSGVADTRFNRIEGVADREPYIANNPYDPRNRRVSITLRYRD
ncbi:flagellar motor protein MotB [Sphingomonas sp. ID0503]|uniref:flagellar motor protein MotB n=1 Tax=Sphingomonas sp. ID0503 TaxID=3399691 RepID=UPI003AFABB00